MESIKYSLENVSGRPDTILPGVPAVSRPDRIRGVRGLIADLLQMKPARSYHLPKGLAPVLSEALARCPTEEIVTNCSWTCEESWSGTMEYALSSGPVLAEQRGVFLCQVSETELALLMDLSKRNDAYNKDADGYSLWITGDQRLAIFAWFCGYRTYGRLSGRGYTGSEQTEHDYSSHIERMYEFNADGEIQVFVQQPDFFLSYSHADREVARCVADALKSKGATIWLDEGRMLGGDLISERIDEGIAQSAFVVALITENWIRSEWCARELEQARAAFSRSGKARPIPVQVDGTELPPELKDVLALYGSSKDPEAIAQKVFSDARAHIEEAQNARRNSPR